MRANAYNRFMNIAHRGFSGAQPENTLASFKAAVEMGIGLLGAMFGLLMIDILLYYDATVDRTTNGR